MERESSRQQQQPWSYSYGLFTASSYPAWPPRSYACNFCKREFRSAQALGGHMNVHRRDRARLRHGSPPPLLPPPATAKAPVVTSPQLPPPVPNLNYPPSRPSLPQHPRHCPDGGKNHSWTTHESLGLGLGVLSSSSSTTDTTNPAAGHAEDDGLDLELRLGVP